MALALVTTMSVVRSASAVTGYVTGTFSLWNKNGNYCPTSNTCTGAYYTQSMYDGWAPISNGSVWIVDSSDAIIGAGSTDDNGNYTVSWTRSTFPAQIGVVVLPSQKDGRFHFSNSLGQLINSWGGLVNTAAGTSLGSPQNMGSTGFGTTGAPDPFFNAYWAAEWQWRYTMNKLGVLQGFFTNVEVRGFVDTIPGYITTAGTCTTSCAWGPTKQVHLDVNAGFEPQARAMHELGHIASYVTHAWHISTDGTTASTQALNYAWGGNQGWSQNAAEYGAVSFEEGFATHYGSVTFWADFATTPTTCLSATHCYNGAGVPSAGTDLEATSFPHATNNCSAAVGNPESRWPLSAMRYLWDVFDNHNDADGDTYSANAAGEFWKHLHNLAFYPEGVGATQIDEPWDSVSYTSVTEPDGRGCASYEESYRLNAVNTHLLRVDNCLAP